MLHLLNAAPAVVLMLSAGICTCRYGFVKFTPRESGQKAINDLNQSEMAEFPGMKVGCMLPSTLHCSTISTAASLGTPHAAA